MNTPTPARRRKIGRPTKFTEPTQRRLIETVAKGLPFIHACAASGVSFQSFCAYRNDHPEFQEAIERAVAAAIEKRLALIEKAADLGDVGCARWLLEHLHQQYFARNRIEITGADGAPIAGAVAVYLPRKDGEPHPVVEVNGRELEDAPA